MNTMEPVQPTPPPDAQAATALPNAQTQSGGRLSRFSGAASRVLGLEQPATLAQGSAPSFEPSVPGIQPRVDTSPATASVPSPWANPDATPKPIATPDPLASIAAEPTPPPAPEPNVTPIVDQAAAQQEPTVVPTPELTPAVSPVWTPNTAPTPEPTPTIRIDPDMKPISAPSVEPISPDDYTSINPEAYTAPIEAESPTAVESLSDQEILKIRQVLSLFNPSALGPDVANNDQANPKPISPEPAITTPAVDVSLTPSSPITNQPQSRII